MTMAIHSKYKVFQRHRKAGRKHNNNRIRQRAKNFHSEKYPFCVWLQMQFRSNKHRAKRLLELVH